MLLGLKVCDVGILILIIMFLQRFGDGILSPSSGGTYSVGPNRES
jgi:hypothetical protein